jgi:hypothetical protein
MSGNTKPYLDRSLKNTGGVRDGGGKRGGRVAEHVPQIYSKAPKGLRLRDARVGAMTKRYLAAFSWLATADTDLLRIHCMLLILAEEAFAKIREDGLATATGHPHRLLDDFRGLCKTLAFTASRLGLSPVDRASMLSSNASTALSLDNLDLRAVNRVLRQRTDGGDHLIVAKPKPATQMDDGDAEGTDSSASDPSGAE